MTHSYYPPYGFQNQKPPHGPFNNMPNIGNFVPNARGPMGENYSHIGLNAPPYTNRGIDFSHNEPHLFGGHGGPMVPLPGMHPNHPGYAQAPQNFQNPHRPENIPMRSLLSTKTAGSQDGEHNYQPLNFAPTN